MAGKNKKLMGVIIVIGMFLFSNCALVLKGTRQKIPVSSIPSGATVMVDGEEKGTTPLILKLKRKKKLHIVQINKPGYEAVEVRVRRMRPGIGDQIILGGGYGACGLLVATLFRPQIIGSMDEDMPFGEGLGRLILYESLATVGTAMILSLPDLVSGAMYNLSPENIFLKLLKIEENR